MDFLPIGRIGPWSRTISIQIFIGPRSWCPFVVICSWVVCLMDFIKRVHTHTHLYYLYRHRIWTGTVPRNTHVSPMSTEIFFYGIFEKKSTLICTGMVVAARRILTLMSRWAIFRWCMYAKPSTTWCINLTASASKGTLSSSMTFCRSPPGALGKKKQTLQKYKS